MPEEAFGFCIFRDYSSIPKFHRLLLNGINADLFPVCAQTLKFHLAVHQSKQSVIRAAAYIGAGMNFGTALLDKNVASQHKLDVYKRQGPLC